VSKLAKKALNYQTCVGKCSEHLNEHISDLERHFRRQADTSVEACQDSNALENLLEQDYKQRLKLWLDLCRISRKQQIWDICRVSCRFLVLYDRKDLIERFLLKKKSLYDMELMRNLAEAHFIFGEALVQFLRNEGIELFDKPDTPELDKANHQTTTKKTNDTKLRLSIKQNDHHSLFPRRDFRTDREWLDYTEWLDSLSREVMDHFMRGVEIGVQLNESWLVCQGSAYAWNYMHHIFEKNNHKRVVGTLNQVLDAMRTTGHSTEPELLVSICVALAKGLMMPWLPVEQVKPMLIPNLEIETDTKDKQGRKSPTKKSTTAAPVVATSKAFTLPAEALIDVKKALEITEYALNVTNGDNPADVVSLRYRHDLIKTWSLAKQINQSPIKNFGLKPLVEGNERNQDKFTKCMVGIESLNRNMRLPGGLTIYEIKDSLSVKELIDLMDQAFTWPDRLVELELWTNIAVLAGRFGQTENLRYSHCKALETISYFEKNKKASGDGRHFYLTSQVLLSQVCIALGEHLAQLINKPRLGGKQTSVSSTSVSKLEKIGSQREPQNSSTTTIMSGVSTGKDSRVTLRRDALNALSDGCGYAALAESYELAVHAARHWWNLCLPYLGQSEERSTLFENLDEILKSLQVVFKFKAKETVNVVGDDEEIDSGGAGVEDGKKSDAKKDCKYWFIFV